MAGPDNLAGHHTPAMVIWLFQHGIMPQYTPLGGSWLNMAESIQRILVKSQCSRKQVTAMILQQSTAKDEQRKLAVAILRLGRFIDSPESCHLTAIERTHPCQITV